MAASYPTSVKAFTTKNTGDAVQAAHVNDLQDEVTAIENALRNGIAHAVSITGALTVTGAITATGTIGSSGLGTHAFTAAGVGFNILRASNSTSGVGNGSYFEALAGTTTAQLVAYSQGFTTSGPSVAAGGLVFANGAGGLSIQVEHASANLRLYTGTTLRTQLTSTGLLEHNSAFGLSGILTTAQIVANTNDYAPASFSTSTWLRMSSDAGRDLTGIAGGAIGRMVFLSNQGGFTITLKHESGSSTAANRFQCPGGVDFALTTAKSVLIYYDSSAVRWYVVGS